ncbi:glycosyltransferase family 2 protein [Glaciibacter flavus]|uniref:glycosyltransferase family 2 protein n=1 Tax=Orlajensenia flava TaxID=2565934 RepID=UPI003AFFBB43
MSAVDTVIGAIVDARGVPMERVEASIDSLTAAGVSDVRVLETDEGLDDVLTTDAGWTHAVWIEGGAVLLPAGLTALSGVTARFPDTAMVYADDWHIRRPDFSPVRLRTQDYLGAVRLFRIDAVRAVGGFRSEAAAAASFDLALRLTAAGAKVVHSPEIIYRNDLPRRPDSGASVAAVERHLIELGIRGSVHAADAGILKIEYEIDGDPLISIVIPTRGSSATIAGRERVLVASAIRSILERTTRTNLEFVVVADDETPQTVVDELQEVAGEALRLVRWSGAFSFAGKMNRGAVFARGEYLLLLNDDVEVATPGWLDAMLGLAQQPGVGLVGCLLFFEDGSIQHGGHLYRDGAAGHIAFKWPSEWNDPLGSLSVEREVSGVTAACALMRADAFWDVGGFSTLFPSNYNDVDLCMKLRATGHSILWTPKARLYHFESKTRVATVAPAESSALERRWNDRMQRDGYWPDYLS